MGKQINYYMGYNDFLQIAQKALDSGCEILTRESGKLIRSNIIPLLPLTGITIIFTYRKPAPPDIQIRNSQESIGGYNSSGNVLIEAGFSRINHSGKAIYRARLFP